MHSCAVSTIIRGGPKGGPNFIICSLRLNSEDIVADLHESEHVDLGRNGSLLGLSEVEL